MPGERSTSRVLRALACAAIAVGALPASSHAVGFTAPLEHPVGNGPTDVVAADLNGDGDPDLATVNNLSYDVSVLLGGAGASFSAPATYAAGGGYPLNIVSGEFDGDTHADLAVTTWAPDGIGALLGAGDGTLGVVVSSNFGTDNPGGGPEALGVGDFDKDGHADLVAGTTVFTGGTGGAFTEGAQLTAGSRTTGVAVADFNGDNDLDLAFVNKNSDDVSILLGGAGASFGTATNIPLPTTPGPDADPRIAVGDFNGDGDPDLVAGGKGDVAVLLGGIGGSFGAPTRIVAGQGPSDVTVADLDGDGHDDIAVANGYSLDVSVLLGAGNGTFAPQVRFAAPAPMPLFAITTADVNGDGDRDIVVVSNQSDRLEVLLNTAHAPAAPTLSGTDPASPANANAPKVLGQAPAGTIVALYTTADCSGTPAATGSAAQLASPGLPVSVADDSTTTFKAIATNAADVPSACSSSATTFIEHSSPPRAAIGITPGVALTGTMVTFDASATTGYGISRYEWDLDGNGSFETSTGASPVAQHAYATPGDLSIGVRVNNDVGSSEARGALSVRLTPPAGNVGVSINSGAQFTNDPKVSVATVWSPFAKTLLLSNDGGFTVTGRFAVAARTPWTLDSTGPERLPKTVYARFDDGTQTFTDDIVLDETAPTVDSATMAPAGATRAARAAAARRRTYRIAIVARDRTSGVRGVQVTTNKRKPGKLQVFKRTSRMRRTIRFRTASARVYVRVRDAAGNDSRWRQARRTAR